MCCNSNGLFVDEGSVEFYRGDTRAKIGLRNLYRDAEDIGCGIQNMERGYRMTARNVPNNRHGCCRCNGHNHCSLPNGGPGGEFVPWPPAPIF